MTKKKKLTRKDKIELSKQNICWKCNGKIEYNKELKSLKCEKCDIEIDVKNRIKM